ncbi:hypothetical protein CCACVL1_04741 [Corchorus capsularis]|uniref:Uncharacterized protein n=1 Tax=Corchorus capsularis TaxID=210143 RepID=A0A1R3JQ97_COCAP|nr:hypothetical protein CCACVL1_04741 [Corchorus capsularis]
MILIVLQIIVQGPDEVLLLSLNPEEISSNRFFWSHYIIGYLLDFRIFSVRHLQYLISREWRANEVVSVIGRQGSIYTIFVEDDDDRDRIIRRGPYAFEGAFFPVDYWPTNSIIRTIRPERVPIWVQLWDLPQEYQVISIAQRLASLAREVIEVDWMNIIPWNIRYMRVHIWIDPFKPRISGFMLQLDDGRLVKIIYKYERACKVCLNWGIIGHTTPHCPYDNMETERMLNEQMANIQERRGKRILPMDSGPLNAPHLNVPESSQMVAVRTSQNLSLVDLFCPETLGLEVYLNSEFFITAEINHFNGFPTLPYLNAPLPTLDTTPLLLDMDMQPPSLSLTLVENSSTGTLPDIVANVSQTQSITLEEWIQRREVIDETNHFLPSNQEVAITMQIEADMQLVQPISTEPQD